MFFSVELFSIIVLSFHCTFSFIINNEMQMLLELIITRSLSLFFFLPQIQTYSSSGRLLLVDATGEVDVVIPDLPSDVNVQTIYEVA